MKKKIIPVLVLMLIPFLFSGCITSALRRQVRSSRDVNPFESGETDSTGKFFKVFISADIPDVQIYVDGYFVGNNSLETHFRAGVYRIEVRAAGYQTWQTDLILDKTYTLTAEMVPLEAQS